MRVRVCSINSFSICVHTKPTHSISHTLTTLVMGRRQNEKKRNDRVIGVVEKIEGENLWPNLYLEQ